MNLIHNIQIPTNKVFGVSFWGPNTFSPRVWMRNTKLEMAEFTASSMFGDLKGRWAVKKIHTPLQSMGLVYLPIYLLIYHKHQPNVYR